MATKAEFQAQLKRFISEGYKLINTWHDLDSNVDDLVSRQYPSYLPSFDEFVNDLSNWKEHIEDSRLSGAPRRRR